MQKLACSLTLVLLVLATGCAPRSAADLSLRSIQAVPITTPRLFRYGPARATVESRFETELVGKDLNVTVDSHYSVADRKQDLQWRVTLTGVMGRTTPADPTTLPRVVMITDRLGNIKESHAEYPALEQTTRQLGMDMADQAKARLQIGSLGPAMPETPLKTGDAFRPATVFGLNSFPMLKTADLAYVLQGSFDYKGVEYILAVLDHQTGVGDPFGLVNATLNVNGYLVVRADNLALAREQLDIKVSDARAGDLAHFRLLTRGYEE